MNIPFIEKWTWIAIFVGLVVGGFGLALRGSDAALGWGVTGLGALLLAVGLVLIVVRSRIKD
jgi:hypothetical protein